MIVLGFNINEDDNHINSQIREFIESDKQLIVICEEEVVEKKNQILKSLRLDESKSNNIHPIKVSYGNNEDVIKKLFEYITDLKTLGEMSCPN